MQWRTLRSRWGLPLHVHDIKTPEDIPIAFDEAITVGAEGAVVTEESMFSVHRAKLAHEAAAHKMPVVYPFLLPVTDSGGLIAYAANASDLHRHAAMYVDRILKGAKVGDLPVQQPTTFELVVNMKTGKELGLSIPTNLIARTTDLVE